jgi:hypothetical protein
VLLLCCCRYKQTLDLQVQQRQHEKWERLFIERVQYKKTVAVSGAQLHCPDNAHVHLCSHAVLPQNMRYASLQNQLPCHLKEGKCD